MHQTVLQYASRNTQRAAYLGVLTSLLVLLSACGGSVAATTQHNAHPISASSASSCDPMTIITVTEKKVAGKADQYTFQPASATIKQGEFLTFANSTDQSYQLHNHTTANLGDAIIDANELQPVEFTTAGTYHISDAQAPASGQAQITVADTPGKTCGITTPVMSVKFTETKTAGKPDQYTFSPATVIVARGDTLMLNNTTDDNHQFQCMPDPSTDRHVLQIDKGEKQILQFNAFGQFTCRSKAHPATALIVTVR